MKKKQNKSDRRIYEALKKAVCPVVLTAVVFGSVARGENDKDSDVDILIVISDQYTKLKTR